MKKQLNDKNEDLKRRRREIVIICIILPIIILLTYLGTKIFDLGLELPIANSILIFALININVKEVKEIKNPTGKPLPLVISKVKIGDALKILESQ